MNVFVVTKANNFYTVYFQIAYIKKPNNEFLSLQSNYPAKTDR